MSAHHHNRTIIAREVISIILEFFEQHRGFETTSLIGAGPSDAGPGRVLPWLSDHDSAEAMFEGMAGFPLIPGRRAG